MNPSIELGEVLHFTYFLDKFEHFVPAIRAAVLISSTIVHTVVLFVDCHEALYEIWLNILDAVQSSWANSDSPRIENPNAFSCGVHYDHATVKFEEFRSHNLRASWRIRKALDTKGPRPLRRSDDVHCAEILQRNC
jgi:hypothetical protein